MVFSGSLCFYKSTDSYYPFIFTALSHPCFDWPPAPALPVQLTAHLVKRHPGKSSILIRILCPHKRVQSQTDKRQTTALKLSSLACGPPAQCSVDLLRNDKFYWQATIMGPNSPIQVAFAF